MIVVDTCIVVYLFNESEFTPHANQLLEVTPQWIVPKLWREEYANVLAKSSKLYRVKAQEVILNFNTVLEQLMGREKHVDIVEALRIALERDISVYDAHFVTLAIEKETYLVTEDREVIKKCPDIALSIKDYIKKVS